MTDLGDTMIWFIATAIMVVVVLGGGVALSVRATSHRVRVHKKD